MGQLAQVEDRYGNKYKNWSRKFLQNLRMKTAIRHFLAHLPIPPQTALSQLRHANCNLNCSGINYTTNRIQWDGPGDFAIHLRNSSLPTSWKCLLELEGTPPQPDPAISLGYILFRLHLFVLFLANQTSDHLHETCFHLITTQLCPSANPRRQSHPYASNALSKNPGIF